MKRKILLLIGLLVLIHGSINAQQYFSLGKDGMSFIEFSTELKNKYNIQCFYKIDWVNDIYLTKTYKDEKLENILEDILYDKKLKFIIRQNIIVITNKLDFNSTFSAYEIKKDNIELSENSPESNSDLSKLQEQEYRIHYIGSSIGKKKVKLFGYISHHESLTPLNSVEIYLPNIAQGVTSDSKGYYEFELPPGRYNLQFKYMGLKSTTRKVNLRGTGRLDVQMTNEIRQIKEVRVTAKNDKVARSSMGIEHIKMEEVHSLPTALGEPDIIKSTTMLPGVESAGEGAIGFSVRGGSADQNLILIDNAPIYYPAHFFGFFSPFNSDIINEASLYKASIPVKFGGRISSTYDIHAHDNINNKIKTKLGVSPVTSKVYSSIPIVEDKLSIVNSFRFTYSDWVMERINSKELINSKADFYDIHGKVLYKPNQNNQLSLSYYNSNDEFQLHSDTIYNFKNFIGSINWRHRFSEKLKVLQTAYTTHFSYDMSSDEVTTNAFNLTHKVKETGFKSSWNYEKNLNTSFDFGGDVKYYNIEPGKMTAASESSYIKTKEIGKEKAIEGALFLGSTFDLTSSITVEGGIRYSLFGNVGSKNELIYENNVIGELNIIDTINSSGIYNISHGPEVRLGLSYRLSSQSSVKVSYNRNRQYIHLLSNTTAISPTDTWKLSDKYMKAQIGDQLSLGFYKNFKNSASEFSVEAYYKKIKNVKDYKDGAELYLNEFAEMEVINARGKNYGIEFLYRKNIGRFKAMLSYSYSRSYLKSADKTGEFAINDGEYYRAPFDKPHNIKSFLSLKLSRRFILSTNLTYQTGRPATYPIAKYYIQGIPVMHYSERNSYRLPDYFRADFSLLMQGNLKKKKAFHSSLIFGVYNVTGRKNAHSVYFRSAHNNVTGYKLSIFGQAVPTITYNIEF